MFRLHSSFVVHGPLQLGLLEEGKISALAHLHFPSLDCCMITGYDGALLQYDHTVIVSWAFKLVAELHAVDSFWSIRPMFSIVSCCLY